MRLTGNSLGSRGRTTLILVVFGLMAIALAGAVLAYRPSLAVGIIAGTVAAALGLLYLRQPAEWRGVLALSAGGFLITGYPVARVVFGGMPIYFLDVCIVLAAASVLLLDKPDLSCVRPLPGLIFVYMLLTAASTVHGIVMTGVLAQPLYMMVRFTLSMSLALLVPALIRTRQHLQVLLWGLALGMVVTASFSILHALPLPNNPIRHVIIPALYPINEDLYTVKYLGDVGPTRGFSLAGVATMTASVITMAWPLVLGMYFSREFIARRRWIWAMLVIGMAGAAMTYSRAAYLAFGFMLVALLWTRGKARWGRVGTGMGLVLLLFVLLPLVLVGQGGSLFRFGYLSGKFLSILTDPEGPGNSARVLTYLSLLPFLAEHPLWLVLGRGVGWSKLDARGLIQSSDWQGIASGTQEHSLWGAVTHQRGFLAAILLALALLVAVWKIRQSRRLVPHGSRRWEWLASGLSLAFIGAVAFAMVDHMQATSVHGQGLLFILFGLVAVLVRFSAQEEPLSPPDAQAGPDDPALRVTGADR